MLPSKKDLEVEAFMQITELALKGGGMLRAVETDKFKRSSLFLTCAVDIAPGTTPCDMVLLQLLSRRTADHPSNAALSRRCEELYGAVATCFCSSIADKLLIVQCGEFVSDAALGTDGEIARGVVQLMASMWLRPALDEAGLFPEDEVAHAKAALCDSIRAADNSPAHYASRRCRELACAGTVHGYSVTVDEVEAVSREQLTARYHCLCRSRLSAFYVGDAPERIAALLPEYYSAVSIAGPALLAPSAVQPCGDTAAQVDEARAIAQGNLCMAFYSGVTLGDTEEHYAMLMAVEVLGSSPVAKLFMNVRERLGLCYDCSATYNAHSGMVYIVSGIAADDRGQVEREIMAQLDELRLGHITAEELEAARLSLINSAAQIEDRPYSIWRFAEQRLRAGLEMSPEHYIERIRAVTTADIMRVSAAWRTGPSFFVYPENEEVGHDD